MNERYSTYQEREYWSKTDGPPCSESYPLADVDRRKEMVELTAAGLIPPRALGRNGDDFHRGGLKREISLQSYELWARIDSLSLVPVICLVAGLHMCAKENERKIKESGRKKPKALTNPVTTLFKLSYADSCFVVTSEPSASVKWRGFLNQYDYLLFFLHG